MAYKLKTSRQYVNQTKQTIEAKLSKALLEVARLNDLQIIRLYQENAILLGYHPGLNRKAVITYTTNHGIKVWYWYDTPEEVTNEDFLRETREYLLEIACERGIELEEKTMHPAKLAHIVFSKLIPELKS